MLFPQSPKHEGLGEGGAVIQVPLPKTDYPLHLVRWGVDNIYGRALQDWGGPR